MLFCLSTILAVPLLVHVCVSAALVNITVDDQGSDPQSGSLIVYSPAESWRTYPPISGAWNSTLHESTFPGGSSQTSSSTNVTPGNLIFTFTGR